MSEIVFGRRNFLRGASGVVVGLPFLQMFAASASAQAARPPRLVIVFYPEGTLLNRWKPASFGALPATLPQLLQPLAPHADKLNVLSGIDNVVSPMMTASNGHNGAARSILTCQPFQGVKSGQQPANGPADGPSFDWSVGPKIQGDAPRPVVNLGICNGVLGENTVFWQAAGQSAGLDGDPRAATTKLFTGVGAPSEPAPKPSPAEILRSRRGSVLDAVLGGFNSLSKRAPAEDRARLDAHAEQIRSLEKLSSGPGDLAGVSCARPELSIPGDYKASSSAYDNVSAPAQIENAVMALACDVTRVVSLQFTEANVPTFPWLFDGSTSAVTRSSVGRVYSDWHNVVHDAAKFKDTLALDTLAAGFSWYLSQVALLTKRLSEIDDGPDGKLIDNTIVLALSEFGDGAAHFTSNLPVVTLGGAGLGVRTGQHLNHSGYTTGDLYTTLQSILAKDTTPFGMTGTLKTRQSHKGLLPGLTDPRNLACASLKRRKA